MAHDGEFIIGGRKRKSSGSQGTPRTRTSTCGRSLILKSSWASCRAGSFTKHKKGDGEGVQLVHLQSGQLVAKWTGSELTYVHTDHLGTPISGTHGAGTGHQVGDVVFAEFYTPFGLNPTNGWHGANSKSGFDGANGDGTGAGSNIEVFGLTGHQEDHLTGLTHMQARQYDPVLGRFVSVDPVHFFDNTRSAMVNRYGYSSGDPMNRLDPVGNTDIFVGGFGDKGLRTNVVRGYQESYREQRPSRSVGYHGRKDLEGIVTALKSAESIGGPVNVACHSMGCTDTLRAIRYSGVKVDNLATIDPVGSLGDGTKPSNVENWINVEGIPGVGEHDYNDWIEGVGEGIFSQSKTHGADSNNKSDHNHNEFGAMMDSQLEPGKSVQEVFDDEYIGYYGQ